MSLLDILNDEKLAAQLSKQFDEKLASKDFWIEDEKNYKLIQDKIDREHKAIIMTYAKYNRVFQYLPI